MKLPTLLEDESWKNMYCVYTTSMRKIVYREEESEWSVTLSRLFYHCLQVYLKWPLFPLGPIDKIKRMNGLLTLAKRLVLLCLISLFHFISFGFISFHLVPLNHSICFVDLPPGGCSRYFVTLNISPRNNQQMVAANQILYLINSLGPPSKGWKVVGEIWIFCLKSQRGKSNRETKWHKFGATLAEQVDQPIDHRHLGGRRGRRRRCRLFQVATSQSVRRTTEKCCSFQLRNPNVGRSFDSKLDTQQRSTWPASLRNSKKGSGFNAN